MDKGLWGHSGRNGKLWNVWEEKRSGKTWQVSIRLKNTSQLKLWLSFSFIRIIGLQSQKRPFKIITLIPEMVELKKGNMPRSRGGKKIQESHVQCKVVYVRNVVI